MKNAFTMIELIFVIVILGILAAVAIPRLAGTRADAEITSAMANIRTFLSDTATYYIAKGSFDDVADLKWGAFTNVPLVSSTGEKASNLNVFNNTTNALDPVEVFLKIGKNNQCIGIQLLDRAADNSRPAVVKFSDTQGNSDSLCNAVRNANSIRTFTHNAFVCDGCLENGEEGYIGIGPSAQIYQLNID